MKEFSDIIGQNSILDHLAGAVKTGNISHAYILSGDAGTGRKTTAYAFAAALQCADLQWVPAPGGQGERMLPHPCGKCLSCLQVISGNQPDIITVTHEKPGSIGVDEIRRMRADVQIKPYANPYKIYIIPDAEKMTVQAQNALLKTLEEPPEYAVLLLLANGTENFLPTIMSRCVLLRMRAVSETQIEEFLEREDANVIARFAGGSPGRALALAGDEEFLALRDRTVWLLQHLRDADADAIASFAGNVEAERRDDVMSFVMMWYRDVMLYRRTGSADTLIFGEDLQYIIEAADALSEEALGRIMDLTAEASRRLTSNVAADAVLETMFLRIRSAYRRS